jgi:hypothetical protein
MPTPYAEYVEPRDPVEVLRETLTEVHQLRAALTPDVWSRPVAPGKWTVHQIIVHLAQWEMLFGVRVRCAVASRDYVIQPFDQDLLIGEADVLDGPTALDGFEALRKMNVAFAASLTPEMRRRKTMHPERGGIDVEDLLLTLAGHPVHHLRQIQRVL